MLLPSLALPLLNATIPYHTNISNPLDISGDEVGPDSCYQQRAPWQIQRPRTAFTECSRLRHQILLMEQIHVPAHFSREPKHGLKTPYQLFAGSCVFEVDIDPEQERMREWMGNKWWATSWNEILETTVSMLDCCVVWPPHLGGETHIGFYRVLELRVYGADDWVIADLGKIGGS